MLILHMLGASSKGVCPIEAARIGHFPPKEKPQNTCFTGFGAMKSGFAGGFIPTRR